MPAAARDVAAVPYDVVSTSEAAALARGNPLSFLHVSRAEIDLPPGTDPYSDVVYDKARENFSELRARAPLVTEDAPGLYVYRLHRGSHEQTGLAACFSMDEYDSGAIKKHEATRRDKEDDRTRHMLALSAQTGPVFLTYRALPVVNAIVERAAASHEPLFDFVAADGVRHVLWKVDTAAQRTLVAAFADVPALYIADGHHRAASAARVRGELRGRSGTGEWDRFLGVAFPHDQVQILPYNRLVRDLAGHSPSSMLAQLRGVSAVEPGPATPARPGDIAMFLDGAWYTIRTGELTGGSATERLDVSRLQNAVLAPVFGIGDVRADPRIDFVGGGRGTAALEEAVRAGRAAVAFSLHPVGVAELMAISDEGGMMPPKSTWFEPKLRDGLLSHVF